MAREFKEFARKGEGKMSLADSRFKHCFGDLPEIDQIKLKAIIKAIEKKAKLGDLQSTLDY